MKPLNKDHLPINAYKGNVMSLPWVTYIHRFDCMCVWASKSGEMTSYMSMNIIFLNYQNFCRNDFQEYFLTHYIESNGIN